MPIEVTMPKLSPTMETGVIAQWLVKVGDEVKEGDVLADIETDKATMPMKSYDDGTIVLIDHAAGEEVSLGQRVLVLAKKNEVPEKVAASLGGAPGEGGAGRRQARRRRPIDGVRRASRGRGAVAAAAATGVAANGGPADRASGNGQPAEVGNGRQAAERPAGHRPGQVQPAGAEAGRGIERRPRPGARLGPRRTDRPPRCRGILSRPGRRAGPASAAPARPSAAASAAPVPQARPAAAPAGRPAHPHSRMRKTIAAADGPGQAGRARDPPDRRHPRRSPGRRPRGAQQAAAREGIKLSLGDFVTKAVATGLRAHPGVNASFEPDAIVRHGEVNIGIAVALPEGLIVPVLHRADTLGLREIRRQSEALAAAARSNILTGEQLTGGTFTISNLGMYGIRQFDAILNMPEVGILAVGTAEKRPGRRGRPAGRRHRDDRHPDRRPPRR